MEIMDQMDSDTGDGGLFCILTHWNLNKMAEILQTTLSYTFSWMWISSKISLKFGSDNFDLF